MVPFFVQNSNGDSVSFDSQKGKWTLIVLSASWCPACHAQNKALKKVYREEHQNGFRIFMISEDDALANVRKYKEDFEFPWDVYHWNYNAMNALGNPQFIPVSYLVNKQNKIVWIKSGTLKYDELKKELKAQQEQP
ncbi:MAG: TlpA family protein disulfide reductase [Fibrobacteraceae bacterium]|nr:TlpA family protein disulfide reductase [Fibrobacteraceae bacterium]